MDGAINFAIENGLFEFLDKDSLATDDRERGYLVAVTLGRDGDDGAGEVGIPFAEAFGNAVGLPESEGACAGAKSDFRSW